MLADDLDLLARYARHGAEDAFAALVRRHSDLVYSVALRIVRSPQVAEEVAQSVFIELSQNANRMKPGVILSAWLYRVTRSKSVDAMRRESRRQRREQAAALDSAGPESSAEDLEPLLDDALDTLTENDRAAIVLRYFERKSLTDVGDALGVSADAAQKRVTRALDELRAFFTKRGLAAGSVGVAAVLAANSAKAAPAGLATGICTAVKASVSTLTTSSFVSSIIMTTTQKLGVAAIIVLAAGFTIYQIQNGPDTAPGKKASTAVSSAGGHSGTPGARKTVKAKNGPRALLRPRLDEAGKRNLQQDPGAVLSKHDKEEGWSRADDDLLAAWAAKDPAAAMKWVNSGEHAAVQAQILGAVAAGILLHDGKDAMRRFLEEHQQDPQLRPKDQGELEKHLFYHLGREDTFDAAMAMLTEKLNVEPAGTKTTDSGNKDDEDVAIPNEVKVAGLAGMMITGIEGAQYQASAIDYMEAKGISVDFNYWSMQDDIGKDPRYWADWARQRHSDLLPEIVDGWARDQLDEAKAWVRQNVPEDDKRRADIDELLQIRETPPEP